MKNPACAAAKREAEKIGADDCLAALDLLLDVAAYLIEMAAMELRRAHH
jgi:hypothetical protein